MDQKIRLGVLWKNVTREGNRPYLAGRVDVEALEAAVAALRAGGRLLVLGNRKRPDRRDPDCVLWVVPEAGRPRDTDVAPGEDGHEPARPRPTPGPQPHQAPPRRPGPS